MGSDICVNVSCAAPCGHEWKKGWPLRSGGFAQLCVKCGFAYEGAVFCSTFHLGETGWRECRFCNKAIHCGCIVSKSLFEHLDFGGISCISCLNASQLQLMQMTENSNRSVSSTKSDASQQGSDHIDGRLLVGGADEGKLLQLCRIAEASESNHWPQAQKDAMISSSGQNSQEVRCSIRDAADMGFSNVMKPSVQSLTFGSRPTWESKNRHESPAQPSLSMLLGTPSGNSLLPSAGEIAEGRVEGKSSSPFHQGQRSRPILPKPLKTGPGKSLDTSTSLISQARIARPPADGRGKNQLLPRYWPRITDQELEQLSGDLKSTVVPLFEKVLSASDAGRIGRLVLPKACAEAYFPPISHSEGLPLRIQDVKGNEWTFQFRFWPNNNSRMYVLEGVTPCIQSMDLRAGDTVTFSRIDPGGKLVMGFRKASNSVDQQEASTSVVSNGISMKEKTFSGATDNLPSRISYSDLLQSKGSGEPHSNGLSDHLTLGSWDASLPRTENFVDKTNNDSLLRPVSISEKKRTRNIGPKSKRLLIHSEDAHELRLTWEEAQDLLRPPPSVKPSVVTIEDHVFEEYDEPPVFGKKTIFSARQSGEHDQWVQCDDCFKWRKLPVDVLLPPKWTCSDNVWDASRSLCSALEELSPKELENLLRNSRDLKKQRIAENNKSPQEDEPSGLHALASVAILGDNFVDPAESSAGATTRHPRHRRGCTCIVCIQPPSGKGRHKPTCTCNVCMTVKRRFKTLMLRKKKRLSEREADTEQKDEIQHRDVLDKNGSSRDETNNSEREGSLIRSLLEVGESSAGQIDLNCDPDREDMQIDERGLSLTRHLETSHYPLAPLYMNQNGLRSLNLEQQATPHSGLFTQSNGEARGYLPDASVIRDRERRDGEVYCDPQSSQNNLS